MSVNSIEHIVRNCVLAQMAPYLQQFRVMKNQIDAQQQANSITKTQVQTLRSEIQQIKQQNGMLKSNITTLQEKYNQNFNYSLMKCQRKIEHLSDDIKNIQIKLTNYYPQTQQKITLKNQVPQYKSEQNTRIVPKHQNYQLNFNLSQQNTQRQKQISMLRKTEKIFRYQIDNPHNQRFQIDSHLNRIKITYSQQWDGHCYNFIKNIDIPQNQTAKFNLKQTKTVSRYVMTGIGTSKIFGMKDVHKSNQCIAYFSANGNIWNQGICTVGGRPINDGQIISVTLQRSRRLISWIVGSRTLATTQLPPSFCNEQLYWMVLLVHQGDTLQVLLD